MSDERRRKVGRAPNYTIPALVMGGVNLFWIFLVIWAVFGFWAVALLSWGLERAIHALGRRRMRGFDPGAAGPG
ncbi:hypothetical protein [Mesobacterium pallidum]|uniref:hypothetical protein n=1 Tax=Mesobacterium pallidum TaxID=2872037 RepID=UPI001EE23E9D|nr:hypothetical protein [Mesobacterium pallidum]